MPLRPSAHVPHMLCGDVEGLDGTRAWVDLPADLLDRITLWAGGPRGMADAQLDPAALQALIALLSEAEGTMRAADAGAAAGVAGAMLDSDPSSAYKSTT